MFNQRNTNNFNSAILNVGPTLALRCKANKVTLSNKMMLAQCWPYIVYPTPTISQRYKGLPTLVQRSHAAWGDVVYSPN